MIRIRSILPFALLVAASVAHADLTSLNDTFNSETAGTNKTDFANWTVTDGTVDLLGPDFSPLLAGDGNYVDLDGSSEDAGLFTTTEAFAAGTYKLTFDLAGNQRSDIGDEVTVKFGNYSVVLARAGNDPFSTETATVTVASGAHLSFQNAGGDDVGALLDNVKVQAVPEPGSLAALALGSLAILRRKRVR